MAISDHEFEEFTKFTADIRAESDRAAVIVGAAKIDQLLYQILQAFLIPSANSADELLDNEAPLATFSARINAVYRLGLINAEFARALHILRKIRNAFAHELAGVLLDQGSQRDRVKELVRPYLSHSIYQSFLKQYFDDKDTPSHQFRLVVALLSVRLDGVLENVRVIDQKYKTSILPADDSKTTPTSGAQQALAPNGEPAAASATPEDNPSRLPPPGVN